MTADQSRPVPRASVVGSIDRDAAEDLLNEVWADCRTNRFTIDQWVDRIEALVRPVEDDAEPQWSFTPEGHDDEYEYTESSDCDGTHVAYFRRTPKRVAEAGRWEKVDALPEGRRSIYAGEEALS